MHVYGTIFSVTLGYLKNINFNVYTLCTLCLFKNILRYFTFILEYPGVLYIYFRISWVLYIYFSISRGTFNRYAGYPQGILGYPGVLFIYFK